ncbi:MAG: hypothetical protein ACFFD4_10940 [Candidatus Odinarchaeota archaeon]
MPITKDQWAEGRTEEPLEDRIMKFMQTKPDLAYTVEEIMEELDLLTLRHENKDMQRLEYLVARQNVWNALSFLAARNLIESKSIMTGKGFEKYYRIK